MAHDDNRLARLTSVRSEMEAGVIVGGLEERGIHAAMAGIHTTNFRTEAPGWVEVLIAEADLPRAALVLEEIHCENSDVDWSQVDVGDPEEASAPDSRSYWSIWRRLCLMLVVIFLIYEAVVLSAAALLRIFGLVQ